MNKKAFKEIEIINVASQAIKHENMSKYQMVEILKDGDNLYAIPNMGVKINNNNEIFYDVTYASDEFKTKFKDVIKELKVNEKEETKSFLKSIVDKFKKIESKQDIITVINSNSQVLNSLTPQESKIIFNPCQFVKSEEGLKKKEILVQKQINPNEPLYYDVSNLMINDLNTWSKICDETIEFKRQDNGFYVKMDSLENNANYKR